MVGLMSREIIFKRMSLSILLHCMYHAIFASYLMYLFSVFIYSSLWFIIFTIYLWKKTNTSIRHYLFMQPGLDNIGLLLGMHNRKYIISKNHSNVFNKLKYWVKKNCYMICRNLNHSNVFKCLPLSSWFAEICYMFAMKHENKHFCYIQSILSF